MAHPVVERFVTNSKGFWRAYRWVLIVFFIALLCDAFSTMYFMQRRSPGDELHPFVRWVSWALGPVVGPLASAVIKAVCGIVVCIYCRRFTVYILLTATILSLWAAWYNIWGWTMYVPRLLQFLDF